VVDPQQFFQVGEHDGKWSEYDERGVPTKNNKKKKPSKKEKDGLESEFLEAKKAHAQYLKDIEEWEQRKINAESALEKTDPLRWAFRKVGELNDPISVDDFEELFKILGWNRMSRREVSAAKKVAQGCCDTEGKLDLQALRTFTRDMLPSCLLEERLNGDHLDDINPEDMYSPRTWRKKLEDFQVSSPRGEGTAKRKKNKKPTVSTMSPTRKGSKENADAPSGSKEKGARKEGRRPSESASPRGHASQSPRGGKRSSQR